jgi:DNA-binding transcriptional LysR family regulator
LLYSDITFPVASPTVAKRLVGLPLASVLKESLIHDSDGSNWRAWLKAAEITALPTGPQRTFVDHDLALQAAQLGLGVALIRTPMAAAALEGNNLVRLKGPSVRNERGHYVVTKQDEDRKPVLRLVERLRACARGVRMR